MASQVTRFDNFRFLSVGCIKDLVYQTKVQDVVELHCRITAACDTVTPVTLGERWSIVSTFVGPPRAHKWRSIEERQKLANLRILQ
jgi:hypothetical protein